MKQRPKLIDNPLVKQVKILNKDALDLERAATQAFNTHRTRLISQVNKSNPNVIPITTQQNFPTTPVTKGVVYMFNDFNTNTYWVAKYDGSNWQAAINTGILSGYYLGESIQKIGNNWYILPFGGSFAGGPLYRSTDLITWTQIESDLTGAIAYDSSNGDVWIVKWVNPSGDFEVLKSIDDGLTFSSITTLAAADFGKEDYPNVIAGDGHCYVLGSQTGYFGQDPPSIASDIDGWTTHHVGLPGDSTNFSTQPLCLAAPSPYDIDGSISTYRQISYANGRVIFARDEIHEETWHWGTNTLPHCWSEILEWRQGIWYSDSYPTFTHNPIVVHSAISATPFPDNEGEIVCDPGMGPLLSYTNIAFVVGNICKFGADGVYIWMSKDGFATNTLLPVIGSNTWNDSYPTDPAGVLNNKNVIGRIIYNESEDVLYCWIQNYSDSVYAGVYKMSNPGGASPTWTYINYPTEMGDGLTNQNSAFWQALAEA